MNDLDGQSTHNAQIVNCDEVISSLFGTKNPHILLISLDPYA